jgi:hypothetical protein
MQCPFRAAGGAFPAGTPGQRNRAYTRGKPRESHGGRILDAYPAPQVPAIPCQEGL